MASRRRTTRWLISILAGCALAVGGWCLVRQTHRSTAAVDTDRAHRAPAPRWQPGTLPGARPPVPTPGPKPEGAFVPGSALETARALDDGPGPHLDRYGGRSGRLAANRKPGPIEVKAEVASTGKQPELLVWLPSLRVGTEGTTIQARLHPAPDDRPPDGGGDRRGRGRRPDPHPF